jgi:hypothetical protein
VRLPLTQPVPNGWAIVVATAQSPAGPWSYLPARLGANRHVAIFTTTHHSLFTVLGEDVSSLLQWFKSQFLDGLSSGATASATPPECADQAAARSIYTLQSSAGPTVYWCFGMDSTSQRVLRVVNNRLYPMEIQHPGLSVAEKPTIDYGSLASLSHLISGRDSILAPGGQIGYGVSLPAGEESGAQTAMDDFGQSLFALQTGINALLAILTRFGAGGASNGVSVMSDELGDAACADALSGGNPGAILASCLSPKDMVDDFGPAGLLLAPLAAAGALADFFASEFQGLHDIWTHRDQYTIIIDHPSGQAVAGYSAYLGRWYVHDGEICTGQALDLSTYNGTADAPCSGSGTSGWERGYISLSPPQCGFAWVPLSFAYQAGDRVIATASTTNGSGRATTFCTPASSGKIVPCGGLSPEGVVPVTQTLSLVKAGVLKIVVPQGYFGGLTFDWCSPSASQADQQRYCPNG